MTEAINRARVWMVRHHWPARLINLTSGLYLKAYYRKTYGRKVHAD